MDHKVYDEKDVRENNVIAALSYLGLFVLVPLITKKDSPYCQFHAKQGLILLISWFIIRFILIVPIMGWVIGAFGSIFIFIFLIIGIANAIGGNANELPLIGQFGRYLNL